MGWLVISNSDCECNRIMADSIAKSGPAVKRNLGKMFYAPSFLEQPGSRGTAPRQVRTASEID